MADVQLDVTAAQIDSAVQNFVAKTGDAYTVAFTEATSNTQIASGLTLATLFGKISKWYTDFHVVDLGEVPRAGHGHISDFLWSEGEGAYKFTYYEQTFFALTILNSSNILGTIIFEINNDASYNSVELGNITQGGCSGWTHIDFKDNGVLNVYMVSDGDEITRNAYKIDGLMAPTSEYQAANKNYVDSSISTAISGVDTAIGSGVIS